ncbi:hypothetical protein G6L37_02320 [Agrobacterium rubi]|nr:hypothetical protein [Agrobacterium rubi]NTF24230.1 hypothetical protein [Agrobacterium rubi]
MRSVTRPSRIALASGRRLAAVDGDGTPSISGRLTALLDLLPFAASASAVTGYHAVDLIVSSGNPLLAALAMRAASRAGMRVAVAMSGGDDMWPYDLAASDETARIMASALRIDLPQAATGAATEWLLSRILADIPRDFRVIAHHLAPGTRHPQGEAVFFLGEEITTWRAIDPHHARMQVIFNRFMKGRAVMGKMRRGRTVVFSGGLVLTSRPEGFSSSHITDGIISWIGPILPYGSARWDLPTYPDAARGMLEDIVVLSRGLPAVGNPRP